MSKVALKGDALGTGTVTLSAPNTNAAIDFELPVTGTHLASAQSDGMPLGPGGDPVVESGSNSDGEWTRWADGTQITKTTGVGSSSSPVAKTLPVPYIDAEYQVTGSVESASESTSGLNVANRTTTTLDLAALIGNSYTAASQTTWGTQGRWK